MVRRELRVLLLHACSFVLGWVACYMLVSRQQSGSDDRRRVASAAARDADEEEERCGIDDAVLIHARNNPDEEIKMVFAVRNDLKMTKGKMCAQVAHAAVDAVQQAEEDVPDLLELWEECGCTKVCLKVNSEDELLACQKDCQEAGLITSLIEDAGRTQVEEGSKTVCGVGPGPASLIDKCCGHLKLL